MAKLKKNETGCKITYEIVCSEWALFVISTYLEKQFQDDVIWTRQIYLYKTGLLEVKYDSVKKALEMDSKVRKFIKEFKVSEVHKTYKELLEYKNGI
jgi:hypothetical protein